MTDPRKNIPTIMVALGVTGDLMKLKVLPAVFRLHTSGELPEHFRLVGFSRRDWSDDDFRGFLREVIAAQVPDAQPAQIESFLPLLQFSNGEFSSPESFVTLKQALDALDASWGMCSNKIFYFAVSPAHYESIAEDLSRSGLADGCGPSEGWTRIVIEKPFGKDGASAERLEKLLAQYFTEEQIYRIDHYLGKQSFKDMLEYRFENDLFGDKWGAAQVESITVRMHETVGAEKRGAFYDTVGALRDVGQNHALEILAILAMDRPAERSATAIRERRAELLEALVPMEDGMMAEDTFRAQYDGYRAIDGVAPDSTTETFFRLHAQLSHPLWRGVPVILEGGKRLGSAQKDVVIRMKDGTEKRFDIEAPGALGPYERLLEDAICGDQTLFVSAREVAAAWRFVDPIEKAWAANVVPLRTYPPDTGEITLQTNF